MKLELYTKILLSNIAFISVKFAMKFAEVAEVEGREGKEGKEGKEGAPYYITFLSLEIKVSHLIGSFNERDAFFCSPADIQNSMLARA